MELLTANNNSISDIRIPKYKDGAFLMFDVKESYLLNENLCQDVMILPLLARNNDIYLDELTTEMRAKAFEKEDFEQRMHLISGRMAHTSHLCGVMRGHLKEFMKDPKLYKHPIIDH